MWEAKIMTDFIFISANDIHISDTGPRSRIDNFKETMLGKIDQMRIACSKLQADAALITGDLYNLKNPSKNSHRLNQELIQAFRKFPCPIYMIPGNHDLTGNNLESLQEQPLGVLYADGTLVNLTHEILKKNGHKVSLVGIPYIDNFDISTIHIPDKDDSIIQICLMHVYAGPKGTMLFKNRIYGYDELSVLDPDIFILGHYHIDQGIQELGGKHFINIGSMSRGVLSEEDVNHQPQLGFIKISIDGDKKVTRTIQSIKLKIKPVEEVFDMKKWEEAKEESKEIEQFVTKLLDDTKAVQEAGSDFNVVLNTMDITKAVRDKVLHFIHEASAK